MKKEKFDPRDFASFEELPKKKKSEFKPVEEGFVKETVIENKEKSEFMAHAENRVRSELEDAISIMRRNSIERADKEGELAGVEHDKKQKLLILEKLGEDEGVSNAVERLKASFEKQGLERGDLVEVYLKDGSQARGYHDDEEKGAENAMEWSEDNKKAFYALGTRINQGEFSFGIRWHERFPAQGIERVVLVKKRHSSRIA